MLKTKQATREHSIKVWPAPGYPLTRTGKAIVYDGRYRGYRVRIAMHRDEFSYQTRWNAQVFAHNKWQRAMNCPHRTEAKLRLMQYIDAIHRNLEKQQ